MLIKQIIGPLKDIATGSKQIEWVYLQWYEAAKKILHKKTDQGREVVIKFFNGEPSLQQDDVIYIDEGLIICIDIIAVKAIVCKPVSMAEMAYLCYEIGNRHLPLFYENDELAMPYEEPIFNLLSVAGFKLAIENRKLVKQMKTSVAPHGHGNSVPLLTKILQSTGAANE